MEAAIEVAKQSLEGESADQAAVKADLEAKEKALAELMKSFEVRFL